MEWLKEKPRWTLEKTEMAAADFGVLLTLMGIKYESYSVDDREFVNNRRDAIEHNFYFGDYFQYRVSIKYPGIMVKFSDLFSNRIDESGEVIGTYYLSVQEMVEKEEFFKRKGGRAD